MARPRRNAHNANADGVKPSAKGDANGSSSSNESSGKVKNAKGILSYWKPVVGCTCLLISIGVGYVGYLETRVNTPYDDRKMVVRSGLDVPERFWGTYRPGVYFGLKTRDPQSLVTGLMWYFPKRLRPGGDGIRHWCEQNDGLEKYGWIQHDGSTFGVQEIFDGPFLLTTSFVKRLSGLHGGDWTARISITPRSNLVLDEEASILWYTALDENTKGFIKPSSAGSQLTGVRGHTSGLGDFKIKLSNYSGDVEHESYLSTVAPGLHLLRETVISSLRLASDQMGGPKHVVLAGELLPQVASKKTEPNFLVTQVTCKVPCSLDVVFESGSSGTRSETLVGDKYTEALDWHRSRFQQRFENTFYLQNKGYAQEQVAFAQAALSNMIGSIGYFYGTSRVKSAYTKEPVPYWRAPLYTAVPSRSFFPRGFLWDEGFHGLLIAAWDLDIELDIICHWFDLMNVEGWIPREQILGVEALAKVPEEFVTQRNTNANPPTFFLTLQHILKRNKRELSENGRLNVLERLYPRLQAWFNWFNITQRGEIPGSYRWRGRDPHTNRELNPKTLTSGLDDYPRASHPTDLERHIDLRCWIALASQTMTDIADILERQSHKYYETSEYLSHSQLMDQLHWSTYAEAYFDYGYHTDSVQLKRPQPQPRSQNQQNLEKVRVTLKNPEYRLVDSTFGYVSLFPFLLQILEPDNPRLNKTLTDIRNPTLMWTKFGLRSLSKNAPLYMKRNTEHDPPYWRGPIWININYLTVRSLHFYASMDGLFQKHAKEIYDQLHANLIDNIIRQYQRTGYIWEQYNDKTGEGQGCRPFTGWSALVVLLMAEQY